jgi:biopolymer transport protein ExbB
MILAPLQGALAQTLALGGPVVAVLLAMSALALAVAFWKLWQFRTAAVGRHRRLGEAVALWDRGDTAAAQARLGASRSHLAPVIGRGLAAMASGSDPYRLAERLEAEAAAGLARLEAGFRILDTIAQLAPLLGLFGTVLGMIDAFRALQDAGSAVDPQILAGGIWVALLTTAVGLAVAMPVSVILTWFEARVAAERVAADRLLQTLLAPGLLDAAPRPQAAPARAVHAG